MQYGPWAQAVGSSDKVEALSALGHLAVSEKTTTVVFDAAHRRRKTPGAYFSALGAVGFELSAGWVMEIVWGPYPPRHCR